MAHVSYVNSCKQLRNSSVITQKKHSLSMDALTAKRKSSIYLINCKKCGIHYIGQSGKTINERIGGHMTDIRAGNNAKPVSCHFMANQHTLNNVSVIVICMTTRNVNSRLRRSWITTVRRREPEGLNLIQ